MPANFFNKINNEDNDDIKNKLDKININNPEKTLNEKDTEMSSVENEYKEIIKENGLNFKKL